MPSTDKFTKSYSFLQKSLGATITDNATSATLNNYTNIPTDTKVHFIIDRIDSNGNRTNSARELCAADCNGSGLFNIQRGLHGTTAQSHDAGAVVEFVLSGAAWNDLIDGLLVEHKQTGAHSDITADSIVVAGNIEAESFTVTGAGADNGWTVGFNAPDDVTYNGNRSYDLVFNGVDYTSSISAGMRGRTTRIGPAPTQCTSLNGTTQYYNKTSPNKLTFTDDFVVSAWVKLSSYGSNSMVASRYNGTSGWEFFIVSDGTVRLQGRNGGSGNVSYVGSYQSIPLNKWVHIAAQLDMSAFTATTTTSYIMIDGVNVPATVTRAGTNPTALIQAGNLEIGSVNGGSSPFPGKIAQVAIFNAKVTQATMVTYMSQGLSGSETSLASAYSFNNSITDLNTTTPNDLTAQGSAVATNADSPFGTQASGLISATLDYFLVQKASFSTNTTLTVQVPEGCTIPTSGGVSAVAFSTQKAPYGMPIDSGRWVVSSLLLTSNSTTSNANYGSFISGGWSLVVPVGEWVVGWRGQLDNQTTTAVVFNLSKTSLSGLTASAGSQASPYAVKTQGPSAGSSATIFANTYLPQTSTSQQTYVMYTFGSTTSSQLRGDICYADISATPAYL